MYGQRTLCFVQFLHCGNVSSQRMCLRLHVSHPLRDLVWLLRGGPPPGPAILLMSAWKLGLMKFLGGLLSKTSSSERYIPSITVTSVIKTEVLKD